MMASQNKVVKDTRQGDMTNTVANPSQFDLINREFKKKQEVLKASGVEKLYDAYGGEEQQKMPENELQEGLEEKQMEVLDR